MSIEIHVYHHHDSGNTPAWAMDLSNQMEQLKGVIMTAVDDLKSAMGDLIKQANAEIGSLIVQINASPAVADDPAVIALTGQVRDAIVAMATAFTNATNIKIPTPPALPNPPAATGASTGAGA